MVCREGLSFTAAMPGPTPTTKSSLIETTHTVYHNRSTASSTPFPRRVVRIILTDADATDSSGDDEDEGQVVRKVKRVVKQINIDQLPYEESVRKKKPEKIKKRRFGSPDVCCRKKFRGV